MVGGAILAVCVIVAVGFVVLVAIPGQLGIGLNAFEVRLDAVLILVSIAFIAILSIGAWIGYTMASTPPPKPIEEIRAEVNNENKTKSKT
jgi:predicted DNA-binding transcriptional regulator